VKRKDFVMYGEREGVVMKVVDGDKVIWQDLSVIIMERTGTTAYNHPMILKMSELKQKKKRDYTYDSFEVTVSRVTEKAIGCTIDGVDLFVPKSLCNLADSDALNEGDTGSLLIADWWVPKAKQEKLEQQQAPAAFMAPAVPVPDDGIPF